MGALTRREWTLIGLVLLSLGLWVFGSEVINATAVGLLAVSLMLALHVVPWKDITRYNSAWNTLVNPGNAGCYGEWPDPFWLYRLVRQHDEYALKASHQTQR